MMKGILKVRTQMVENMYRSVANMHVHADNTVILRVYILQDFTTVTLTCCLFYSEKYNPEWGL